MWRGKTAVCGRRSGGASRRAAAAAIAAGILRRTGWGRSCRTLGGPGCATAIEGSLTMLLVEMLVLGLVTFAAMLGFIRFCEWV